MFLSVYEGGSRSHKNMRVRRVETIPAVWQRKIEMKRSTSEKIENKQKKLLIWLSNDTGKSA